MMRTFLVTALLVLTAFPSFAQINTADSTVHVVAYWNKGEKQNYRVSYREFQIKGKDTTRLESRSCDVQISVLDSTESSFTTEWTYKNFQSPDMEPLESDQFESTEYLKVQIETDEFGSLSEILNWDELEVYKKKIDAYVEEQMGEVDPKNLDALKIMLDQRASKDPIETLSIPEVIWFHSFHGQSYKQGETIEYLIQVPGLYGNALLDCMVVVSVLEISEEDNFYTLNVLQEVDKEQLIQNTFDFIKSTAETLGEEVPPREETRNQAHQTSLTSSIHTSGWIIRSAATTTIQSGDITTIKERTIELL